MATLSFSNSKRVHEHTDYTHVAAFLPLPASYPQYYSTWAPLQA